MIGFCPALIDTAENKLRFEELYYEHRSLMYNIAYSILKDKHRSEDAVHEAFFSLAKNFSKISGRSCNEIRNYMIIIVRNAALKIHNKNKMEFCSDDAYGDVPDITDIEAETIQKDSEKRMFELITELDSKYSDILMLRYFYDIPNSEISAILGISKENVNIRLMRARNLLKVKLTEEFKNDRTSV